MAAQEALKQEQVEASAGGGMVNVTCPATCAQVDHDRPRRDRPRGRRDAAGHGDRGGQRGAAPGAGARGVQDAAAWAAWTVEALGGLGGRAASAVGGMPGGSRRRAQPRGAPRAEEEVALHAPPVQRLITELGKLPGIGPRTAQRLAFHILRARDEDANALADAIREVKERIGLCEVCFNLADGPRCRSARTSAATPQRHLRRRGARRRHPDRAHARVPRPLPRARRRALADRRRRPRGPADRRALHARRRPTGVTRGRARHEPDDHGRGDGAAHRATRCASARRTSPSRGSPAGCRSAPTSSTPTRSRSASAFARAPPALI